MLAIISNREDLSVDFLVCRLEERGLPYFRLNSEDLGDINYYVVKTKFGFETKVVNGENYFNLNYVNSVLYRRSISPTPSSNIDPQFRPFAKEEIRHLSEGLLPGPQEGTQWVNPIEATEQAERKIRQIRLAPQAGLLVPETLVSNNLYYLKKFVEFHKNVICKPVSNGLLYSEGKWCAIHTRRISQDDLNNFQDVKSCPTLLQQAIPKGLDIRVTFIGEDYFPVQIETPKGSSVDWREEYDKCSQSLCEIPEKVLNGCRNLLNMLSLKYGAFDFIKTPNGEWYFLEVNPVGEWAWLEIDLGLPMRESFINLLYG